MVENPGTSADTDSIRPLNPPIAVTVHETEDRRPETIILKQKSLRIALIDEAWRIDEEWWRPQPIQRIYYRVILQDGRSVTIFRDLVGGGWYQQRA